MNDFIGKADLRDLDEFEKRSHFKNLMTVDDSGLGDGRLEVRLLGLRRMQKASNLIGELKSYTHVMRELQVYSNSQWPDSRFITRWGVEPRQAFVIYMWGKNDLLTYKCHEPQKLATGAPAEFMMLTSQAEMIKSDSFANFFGVYGTRLKFFYDESQRAFRLIIDGANPHGRLQKNGDIIFDEFPR
jgi:hypothetical protein